MDDPTRSDMEEKSRPALGDFLRARRDRPRPADFGFPQGRRRAPGLRREEWLSSAVSES